MVDALSEFEWGCVLYTMLNGIKRDSCFSAAASLAKMCFPRVSVETTQLYIHIYMYVVGGRERYFSCAASVEHQRKDQGLI